MCRAHDRKLAVGERQTDRVGSLGELNVCPDRIPVAAEPFGSVRAGGWSWMLRRTSRGTGVDVLSGGDRAPDRFAPNRAGEHPLPEPVDQLYASDGPRVGEHLDHDRLERQIRQLTR